MNNIDEVVISHIAGARYTNDESKPIFGIVEKLLPFFFGVCPDSFATWSKRLCATKALPTVGNAPWRCWSCYLATLARHNRIDVIKSSRVTGLIRKSAAPSSTAFAMVSPSQRPDISITGIAAVSASERISDSS